MARIKRAKNHHVVRKKERREAPVRELIWNQTRDARSRCPEPANGRSKPRSPRRASQQWLHSAEVVRYLTGRTLQRAAYLNYIHRRMLRVMRFGDTEDISRGAKISNQKHAAKTWVGTQISWNMGTGNLSSSGDAESRMMLRPALDRGVQAVEGATGLTAGRRIACRRQAQSVIYRRRSDKDVG